MRDCITRLFSDDYKRNSTNLCCQLEQVLSNILHNDCFDMSFIQNNVTNVTTKEALRKNGES